MKKLFEDKYIEYCIIAAVFFAICVRIIFFIVSYMLRNTPFPFNAPSAFVFFMLQVAVFVVLIAVIIKRIITHTFLSTCLIYRIAKSTPIVYKSALMLIIPFLFMIIFSLLLMAGITMDGYTMIGLTFSYALFIITSFGFVDQLARIKQMAANITQGENKDPQLTTTGMYLDAKEITKQLSHIDEGLQKALEESTKAERLKTDLITNVSHDIKTPLTSIINYVDLMKKLEIKDETLSSYLDVLDRNSNRLKILTNDLVEASKTGTGNIEVAMEELDLVELVAQAYGGFDGNFSDKGITFIFNHPEEAIIIADGNHMWRVLENIFSNVVKYSLENTRVYGDIRTEDAYVHFTLKNISAAPLNISEDELMEQFVRGERSRHTEGSGLGLYIARSLINLMEGMLQIRIDGDLFEIDVSLKAQIDH